MQNKANLLDAQMNVNKVLTNGYENKRLSGGGENKANTKPIKANQTQSTQSCPPKHQRRRIQNQPPFFVGHNIWYIAQLSQIDFCGQLSRENRALEKPFFSTDNPYLGGNRYKIRLLKQLRKKRSSLKFSRWLCRYQHCGAHLGPTKGLRGIQYIVVVSSRTKKWMISPAAW